MARPIKETPVLTGEDAIRFLEEMDKVVPASPKEIEEMKRNADYLMSKATFVW